LTNRDQTIEDENDDEGRRRTRKIEEAGWQHRHFASQRIEQPTEKMFYPDPPHTFSKAKRCRPKIENAS
jgi:hypothetical protein